MDSTDLPPSARLALQHAQATHDATLDATEPLVVQEQEPAVPSANDPVVVDNAAFAEPIIAGDVPMPRTPTAPLTTATTKEKKKEKLDLSSESAFPSLSPAGSAPRPPALSAWSSSARVKTTTKPTTVHVAATSTTKAKTFTSSAPPVTEMLELPANQQIANLPSKPLGFKGSADVIQQVMSKTGTNIIASTNRSGTTTFLIQGPPADVAKARRELIAGLVVKVCLHAHIKRKRMLISLYIAYCGNCCASYYTSFHYWYQGQEFTTN